jgi:hypothetical protein
MFKVNSVSYGIQMNYSERESRVNRTVYFSDRLDDNFALTIQFSNYTDYVNGANWFQYYGTVVSSPNNTLVSPMTVSIPFINFVGRGIPTNGITFGDETAEIVYIMNLEFEGGYGALGASPSTYQKPTYLGADQFYYPSGTQQGSSVANNEELLYDQTTQLNPTNGQQSNTPVTAQTSTFLPDPLGNPTAVG